MSRAIPWLLAAYLVFSLAVSLLYLGTQYSPDSFSYFDMSQSLFQPVSIIRQYVTFTEYGISFPYLFPLLIWIVNSVTGLGIFSGNVINIAAALVSLYLLIRVSIKLCNSPYPGIIAGAVTFFDQEYMSEMASARAVPLSLMCVLLILNLNIWNLNIWDRDADPADRKMRPVEFFLMGLIAGAGMVVRFDFLVISGLLGVFLVIGSGRFRTVPYYVLGLAVFTLPWVIYSVSLFGTIWVSDNSGTLLMVHPVNPQRFFAPGEEVYTVFDNWRAWFTTRWLIVLRVGGRAVLRPISAAVIVGGLGIALASVRLGKAQPRGFTISLAVWLVIYAAKTAAIVLVGYPDLRYHSETLIIVIFLTLCWISRRYNNPKVWMGFAVAVCLFSVIHLNFGIGAFDNIRPTEYIQEISQLMIDHSGSKEDIRFFNLYRGAFNAYSFGAHTRIRTFAHIEGINEERLLYLTENFIRPNYIYSPDRMSQWMIRLNRYYEIERLGVSNVFALTPR